VQWIFVIDLLNFSFWSSGTAVQRRFGVAYNQKEYTGYWSLCALIRRAMDEGIPILSADYWINGDLEYIFREDAGMEKCPLMEERIKALRLAGRVLKEVYSWN
jgi:hypothetical protein